MNHSLVPSLTWRTAFCATAAVGLSACGSGLGIQKLDDLVVEVDSGGLDIAGDEGGSGNPGGGSDTGFTGGSGDGGSGSSGSGSSGSGSSGSGSSGSGSSGSGSSGSGSGGSGSSSSGSSGSGSGGSTDADGDGYDASVDCDDGDRSVNPGATEVFDGIDNDCDGRVDTDDSSLADGRTGYRDNDNDGYGDSSRTATVCSDRSGYSYTAGDCDDSRNSVHPAATEVCGDGLDNDCSGAEDDSPSCARSLTGGFVTLYGALQLYPGSYNCGLLWNLTGTENTSICPSCDFAFDISAQYDASAGFNDGTCSGMRNFTTTWAYDSNYYGSTPYFLEYYAGSWTPITSNVSYDARTGYWAWGTGLLDYGYSYWFDTYYYTYYQYMVSYVY